MKLFQEYHNTDLQYLLHLFSLRKGFTREEACRLAKEYHAFSCGDFSEILRQWVKYEVLIEKTPGYYTLHPELRPFAAAPSLTERQTLSYLLEQEEARLIFPTGAEKLPREDTGLFACIRPWEPAGKAEELGQLDPTVFRQLLRAIAQGREIRKQYVTAQSAAVQTSVVVPYRFEYSAFDGRWWLISYSRGEDRPIKSRLQNIKAVELLEPHRMQEETIREKILSQLAEEPVVLRIRNRKTALERCFIAFEHMFDLTARRLGEELYELSFRYLRWDGFVILRKLLRLGEQVVLQSPASLKEELKKELSLALAPGEGTDP